MTSGEGMEKELIRFWDTFGEVIKSESLTGVFRRLHEDVGKRTFTDMEMVMFVMEEIIELKSRAENNYE